MYHFKKDNIIIYDKLDSSSLEAQKIIRAGNAKNGLIIWAKEQTKGHGRYGRIWASNDKNNLTFSLIIRNERSIEAMTIYPFISALAIKDAINLFLTPEQSKHLKFKWPNDLLLHNKKISGILLESEVKGNIIEYIICGIGINISSSPSHLKYATSLYAEKIKNINPTQLLQNIAINFEQYLNMANIKNDQTIYDLWLKDAYNLNEEIIVITTKEEIKGIFEGIENGNLIIRQKNGDKRVVLTGDVFFSENEKITTKRDYAKNMTPDGLITI